MRTVSVAAVPGAVAVSGAELAVGTPGGYARFNYPQLELLEVERVCAVSVNAVQFAGGQSPAGLVLLTQDVDRSFASPADWDQALLYLAGGGERRRVALGPGSWKLVHGREGVHAVVYDVIGGRGVRAVALDADPRQPGEVWALRRTFYLVVAADADRLLATTATTLTIVDARDGAVLAEHEFPDRTTTRWTAVAAHGDAILLGGYVLPARDHYVLGRWRPGHPLQTRTVPLDDVFTREQVQAALDCEDTCGADVFQVAAIRVADDGQAVIAFGGDELVAACRSACASARLDVRDLRVDVVRLVDDYEATTGLWLAPDGGVVVDCSGTVCVLPRSG